MNSLARIFDNHAGDYDRWFDTKERYSMLI